jgi:hypothetical protein
LQQSGKYLEVYIVKILGATFMNRYYKGGALKVLSPGKICAARLCFCNNVSHCVIKNWLLMKLRVYFYANN